MVDSADLRVELRGLREELRLLTARVDRAIERLESSGDFELVGSGPSAESRTASGAGSQNASTRDREEAAADTGRFFLRCLRGEPRGDSGRGRIRLQNRLYVVVRAYSGEVHSKPVLVFKAYSEAKRHICHPRAESFGDSIFAGFPSLWEAKLAVATAGFDWPEDQ